MFVCHECKAGDQQLNKSIKGKGKAVRPLALPVYLYMHLLQRLGQPS